MRQNDRSAEGAPPDPQVPDPGPGADDVLPVDVRDALLLDGREDTLEGTLDPALRTRIRDRVWSRIGAAPADAAKLPGADVFRNVLAGPWTELFDGCEMRQLSDDGMECTWLIRLQAGRSLPPHDHRLAAEQCLIVAGEAQIGTTRFHAGDFHVALRGSHHADVRTDAGCVLLLRFASPARERGAAARPR